MTKVLVLIFLVYYSARLKNIEETEKAKRVVAEGRQDWNKSNNDEEHLSASRCESFSILQIITDLSQYKSIGQT